MVNTDFSKGCERVSQSYNETHDVNYQSLGPVSLKLGHCFGLFKVKKRNKLDFSATKCKQPVGSLTSC